MTPALRQVLSRPGWVQPHNPALQIDFAGNRAWNGFSVVPPESLLTVSRASVAYQDDLFGNWREWPANTLRCSDKGALIEEARTNSIRNNSMQGAVAPNTAPTNWSGFAAAQSNVSHTIIGTGTENGIDYIEARFSGTPSATTTNTINFETTTQVAATIGQTWAVSYFAKLVAGALTNTTLRIQMVERNSGGTSITTGNVVVVPTNAALGTQRFPFLRTLTNNLTAFINFQFAYSVTNGLAVDFTVRIGWPQLENHNINATAASVVVTTGGAAYVNGDTITLTGGTGTNIVLTVTNAIAGIIQAGGVSITNAGSYTAAPASPVAQGSTSGIGTGATFTITWTDNAAKGFATSPIRTTSAAVTRAADADRNTLAVPASAVVLSATTAPGVGSANQVLWQYDDGTENNRIRVVRETSTNLRAIVTSGGVEQANLDLSTVANSTGFKMGLRWGANDFAATLNGAAVVTDALGAVPSGLTTQRVGSNSTSTSQWNNVSRSNTQILAGVSNEALRDMTRP